MKILKASAGSGKTYNLAKTYIRLLLEDRERYSYRHILAVTFTNKATAEMKSRILSELHTLATAPQKSHYYGDFVPSLFPDGERLRVKASEILTDILHDYSAFSVSTIDKFFQQTLKAFSREIGRMASYQVELDKESLVHESVDRILDALSEDQKDLLDYLDDSVSDQLGRGERVNVENPLYEISDKLLSDEHRSLTEKFGFRDAEMYSRERLEAVRRESLEAVEAFRTEVEEAAQDVCDTVAAAGLSPEDFYRKFLLKAEDYLDLEGVDPIRPLSDAFVERAMDSDNWFAKSRAASLLPKVNGVLQEPLERFCGLFGAPYNIYCTARILYSQTFTLGIAGRLHESFDALMKEKNVLSLDDSNTILKGIIDGSDAPFVYEKLGVRYKHFLLDEFQDTSLIQWENFRPLLIESEANGQENLVVGDVKQSIYRWRGSDWDLLGSRIQNEFDRVETESLKENHRSTRAVVEFNNSFFRFAAGYLDVGHSYDDVSQEVAAKDTQMGHVRVSFREDQQEAVLESVSSALESGALPSDIAVLVRNNKEGGEISQFLIGHGIRVISDDSLDIKSSILLRRLVSLLSCVNSGWDGTDSDTSVSGFLASALDVEFPDGCRSLPELCELLLRSLVAADPSCLDGQVLYIQSFMDMVQEWTAVNGDNLHHFLKFWDDECKKKISSPEDSAAVRVITVHKSKGLEFPYVVFPFAEKVGLYRSCDRWCLPHCDDDAASLDLALKAVYPVGMTSTAARSLFSEDYDDERFKQKVDNLNLFYVAMTRAAGCLHVIACPPPKTFLNDMSSPSDLSHVLYAYLEGNPDIPVNCNSQGEEYEYGEPYDFNAMERKVRSISYLDSGYPSYPLYGRLGVSADAADFFGEDGVAGTAASARLNGIVLHDILSKVNSPEDLSDAVRDEVLSGRISAEEGREDLNLLSSRLKSVSDKGWFSAANGSNEVSILDTDGTLHRPDRVVCGAEGTVIIDYKFGSPRRSYVSQVERYVSLYRRMGYPDVRGYLWYVLQDEVVEVTDYQRP